MNLALFDFDGTITNKDTFTDFIHYAANPEKIKRGKIVLSPIIIGYKIGFVAASKAREIVGGYAFKHCKSDELFSTGATYAKENIPHYLRKKAMDRIQWHKQQGDQVCIVSASLEVYMSAWCAEHELECICSKLEIVEGITTGKYHPKDCSGKEKVRRIKNKYDLQSFQHIYAYGDTRDDNEMLNLADTKYYRWKQI